MVVKMLQLWIDALRSGAYAQTIGVLLRTHEGQLAHCCLGVLCEVSADVQRNLGMVEHYFAHGVQVQAQLASFCRLDIDIAPLINFLIEEPAPSETNLLLGLAHLNDTQEASFEEIADVLESRLPAAARYEAALARSTVAAQV